MNIHGYKEGEIVRNSCYRFNAFWHDQTYNTACWGLYLDQYPDMSLSTFVPNWWTQFQMKPIRILKHEILGFALAFSDI